MKLKLKLIFLLVLISMESFSQLIIKDTLGVRKPKEGSLYYQTKNQTLYLRRNSSFEIFEVKQNPIIPDLPPDPDPVPETGDAMVVDVDRFASFWGNGGENPSNLYLEHRTYEDEQWMLTNWPLAAPFYAKKIPTKTVIGDNWINNVFSGQASRQVNYEYFVNSDVIDKMNTYMVESGLQGYDFTYYANDSPMCLWRQEFVKNPKKRGLKMYYTISGFGGNVNQGVDEVATHMTQGFYKKIDGKPILGYQIEPGRLSNQESVNEMKNNISLIKKRYRELTGNSSAQFYTILCGVPYLENDGWYLNNGFDSATPYYVDGEKTNGDFGIVVNNTKNLVNSYISANRPIAIPITVGLDTRARLWFYGQDPGGNFYNSQTLVQKLPELIKYAVEKANQNKNLVKIILFKYADEHTEQVSGGFGFMPTLKPDGTINNSVMNVIKNELR